MKFTKIIEAEPRYLHVTANVRYWKDASVNGVEDTDGELTPCRRGDNWCPKIIVDEGKIAGWPFGTTLSVHFRVCDQGSYALYDASNRLLAEIRDGYVPDCMCPNGNGYGDYIIMEVNESGYIKDWKPDFSDFPGAVNNA